EIGGGEDRALGVEIAKAGGGGVARERCVSGGSPDAVGPLPPDLDCVLGAVARAQYERRRGDLRRGEGSVRGHDGSDVAQRWTQLVGKALELACGDLQSRAIENHSLQLRWDRLDETHEPRRPILDSVGGLLPPLGAYDAVSAGAQKQQRLQAVRVLAVDPEDRPRE